MVGAVVEGQSVYKVQRLSGRWTARRRVCHVLQRFEGGGFDVLVCPRHCQLHSSASKKQALVEFFLGRLVNCDAVAVVIAVSAASPLLSSSPPLLLHASAAALLRVCV